MEFTQNTNEIWNECSRASAAIKSLTKCECDLYSYVSFLFSFKIYILTQTTGAINCNPLIHNPRLEF